MKRILIFASAAIVALASCAKTEVVYKDAPQEIAFKQITGPMTKVDPKLSGTMGVFAQYNNTNTSTVNAVYFGNTSFGEDGSTGKWHATVNTLYWPLEGNLDFTIYAPYDATAVEYTPASNANVLVINVPDNKSTQTDWLYGSVRYHEKTKADQNLPVSLKHALSKISVTVKSENTDVFTITGLTLNNAFQSGILTITYASDTPFTGTCVPSTPDSKETSYTYTKLGGSDISNTAVTSAAIPFEDRLVFPSTTSDGNDRYFVLQYKMAGSATELSAKIPVTDAWDTGKHYTYAITMTATEIYLTPTVASWETGTVAGQGTAGDPIVVAPQSAS